jgi:hypothetical protein
MKFTVSTLLALCIAVPVTVVQALDVTVAITSTLLGGSITIFPDHTHVDLDWSNGEEPQHVGELHFTGLGKENSGRFDIIDAQAPGYYEKVSLIILGQAHLLTKK